ncbi:unnamed protein product [Phaedon cochleariae]|uniref:Neurotransmitter-gated ion-channel ligand-binding domain-containing protein n=1 Tax=Phaedon cochleariae TaxID=80249 RepID=A0A9N9SIV7_PHACE|nr:unnamed protein product [Phaedon cochleariae]
MNNKTVFDCFMLMGTVLSIRGCADLPEMTRPSVLQGNDLVTVINIFLVIEEISIHEEELIIEIDGILSQMWLDPRLGANERTKKMAVTGKIWEPKITNINGENVMEKNDDTIFWRGFGDEGNILLSKKIRIRTYCSRDFQNFPFDIQHCDFKFGSYRFPSDEIPLLWDEAQVKIPDKIRTTEFMLLNVTKDIDIEVRPSGNFSIATVKFIIKRNSIHYILCTGIPCIVMLILGYISRWMDIDRRWNINLFSFSISLYLYVTSLCTIQPVPYFKALDIFVGLCTFFSFISLLETFLVDCISKLGKKYLNPRSNANYQTQANRIYCLELGMKIAFPVFCLLFVLFFGFIYIM